MSASFYVVVQRNDGVSASGGANSSDPDPMKTGVACGGCPPSSQRRASWAGGARSAMGADLLQSFQDSVCYIFRSESNANSWLTSAPAQQVCNGALVAGFSTTPQTPAKAVVLVYRWSPYTGTQPSNVLAAPTSFPTQWVAPAGTIFPLQAPTYTDRLEFADEATARAWLATTAGQDYTKSGLVTVVLASAF